MRLYHTLNRIGQRLSLQPRSHVVRRSRRRILELETVEGRTMLSTLLVSPTGPFTSIQAAVSAAPSGATIDVAPGSYSGTVVVNKPLILLGAQAGVNPTTAGARTNPALESTLNGTFQVEASNVTINGFTVQNGKTATGVTDAAGDSNTVLEDNIIQYTKLGVSFVGDTGASISTNLIETSATDGIDLGDASGTTISYNLIEANGNFTAVGQSSQGQGISLSGVTSSSVVDNQVLNNHTDGIEVVLHSSSVYIAGNTVTGQNGMGIAASNSSYLNIHGNTVDSNGAGGIFLSQSQNNWIQYNTVDGNGAQGINLSQTSPDSVDWNTVEHNFGDGIDDGDDGGTLSSHNEFSYNTIEYNGFLPNGTVNQSQGMLLSGATYAVVYDNNVSHNHTDGIEVVLYSTGVLVSDNTVASNGGDGIAVSDSNTGTVEYNSVSYSGADGIHFIGVTNVTVYDNTVANSAIDGISLDATSSGNVIEDNTFSASGLYDAQDVSIGILTAGTANTWTGNTGKTDNHGGRLL